jgi:hypothetical protein
MIEATSAYDPLMSWDEELATVDRFSHVGEAEVVRSALEAAGIEAVLVDQYAARMGSEKGTGGVRLQVRRKDVERATEILRGPVDLAYEPETDGLDAENADVCRHCGSEQVFLLVDRRRLAMRGMAAAVLGLMLVGALRASGLPLPFDVLVLAVIGGSVAFALLALIAPRKRCRSCGAEWRGEQRTA